ncbi:MAG: HlyD family efflux transporter periplasmic adaptor subunit [Trueperaceae bacterium]|nr:HlyD family efflux transporter periplasmic adaptor subunit [Trueperaceae bacterium]
MHSDPSAERRRTPRAAPLALLLALGLGLAGCDLPGGDASDDAPATAAPVEREAPPARLVRTVTPERGTLEATRSASARIRAVRDATVAAGASARVEAVLARPGDTVAADDVVLRLDDDASELQARSARLAVERAEIDLERARRSAEESTQQARAQLRAAESNVASLRRQTAEVRELVAAGGASRSDLESLQANLDNAEATLLQAQDALARAERSGSEDLALLEIALESARVQAEQAEDALDETEVRAPFAGEVVETYLEVGEFAASGQAAFRLQSLDEREAVFDVPPEDATRLLQQGTLTFRYDGRDVRGTLTSSVRPQQQQRLVQLVARLDPDEAGTLPTGALADLRYDVELGEGLLVPAGAIASESGRTWLYVADDGLATRVPVDVLAESGAEAVVAGVDADAYVIYPRPLDVRIGTPVRREAP